MLEQLDADRPEDLPRWLRSYADVCTASGDFAPIAFSGGGSSHIGPANALGVRSSRLPHFHVAEARGIAAALDWRHNIFDAEHGVLKTSRELLRQMQSRALAPKSLMSTARATSFIPQVIVHAIHDGRIRDTDTAKVVTESPINSTYDPVIRSIDAVVVFADASGFTSLTERLAKQENGAEEIGRYLNNFFGPLIDIIVSFGGDVLKFSGDAMTVLWPILPEGESKEDSEVYRKWSSTSGSAAQKACTCCMQMQSQVDSVGKTSIEGLQLALHIGVGLGHLHILQLGGLMDRWEYCAAGPPLEEVAVAEPLASPGQTVLAPSVVAALQGSSQGFKSQFAKVPEPSAPEGYKLLVAVHGDRLSNWSASVGLSGIEQLFSDWFGAAAGATGLFKRNSRGGGVPPQTVKSPANERTPAPQMTAMSSTAGDDALQLAPKTVSPSQAELVERYLPRAVLRSLSDGELMPEMRRASIVFLSLRGTDPGGTQEDAVRTQLVVRLLQRSCYALEGSVNKFLVDDKGMVLLACFGLPPLNHFTDDPLRAVLAAARFCDTLREENLEGRAGIATGMCWCGVVGSEVRREYTVLGDVVNLSARLMGRAGQNCVLVDEATYKACGNILEFRSLGEITVKGKADPLPVHEFAGTTSPQLKGKQPNPSLLGWDRWPAKATLERSLAPHVPDEGGSARSGFIVVKGGPGSGKTEIAAHIRNWAREQGMALLSGQNMNVTSTIAVHLLCWQEVFKQLMTVAASDPYWTRKLGETGVAPRELSSSSTYLYQLLMTMLKEAGASQDLLAWAPLMNAVLTGLDFGPKVVQAMLERDEQHTKERSRLGELCETLVDAFATYSTVHKGTLVLVHLKKSTSFFPAQDEHSAHIARALARLTDRRNSEGRPQPLLLCVVSRSGLLADEVLEKVTHGSLVDVTDLSLRHTEQYMQQLLSNPEPDENLVNYIFTTSGGNPFAIGELCHKLISESVIELQGASFNLAADWSDPGRMHRELQYPEKLVGVALAEFEKLSPSQQHLLKIAAVFCQETSEDANSSFCALDLAESLWKSQSVASGSDVDTCKTVSDADMARVEEHCCRLRSADIFVDAPNYRALGTYTIELNEDAGEDSQHPSIADSRSQSMRCITDGSTAEQRTYFRFKSQLLRHVASTLVLKAQHDDILARMTRSARTSRRLLTATLPRSRRSDSSLPSLPSVPSQRSVATLALPSMRQRSDQSRDPELHELSAGPRVTVTVSSPTSHSGATPVVTSMLSYPTL